MPFKWYPKDEIARARRRVAAARSHRESTASRSISVIATKFPTYFVRHPNKVTWLFHQYRAIYDLCGTPYSDFDHTERDVRLRDRLIALDTEVLGESTRCSPTRATPPRGSRSTTASPPSRCTIRRRSPAGSKAGPSGDYVLSVGRLEAIKRVDLIVRALAHVDRARAAGRRRRRAAAAAARRRRRGRAASPTASRSPAPSTKRRWSTCTRGALAVVFPPFDEDYGYVTLEAFLARKPVVTTTDAGGPLEFVDDGVTGLWSTDAGRRRARDRTRSPPTGGARAQRSANAGYERARGITWDGVVDRLMADR